MKMTANRKLILRRLEQGPATTSQMREVTGHQQTVMYLMMRALVDGGLVKNTGPKWRARWELVK